MKLLIILILCIISIQDLKYYLVYDRYFIILYSSLLFESSLSLSILKLILLAIFILFYKLEMFGGADIKLLFYAMLVMNDGQFISLIFFSNICGLFLCVILKKKRIPFIPCIVLGILISFIYDIRFFL